MTELNPCVSWIKKNNIIALYINYNFYFLQNKPVFWFERISKGDFEGVPEEFLNYLKDMGILV